MLKWFKRSSYNATTVSYVEILMLFCTIWMVCLIALHNYVNYKHSELSPIFKALEVPWISALLLFSSTISMVIGCIAYCFKRTTEVTVFLFSQILFWVLLCVACGYFDLFTPVVGFSGMFGSTAYYLYHERVKFISSLENLNKVKEEGDVRER